MESNIEQLLRNADCFPDDTYLRTLLDDDLFGTYKEFMYAISKLEMTYEWRYYNDGKAWLGKVTYKKKTVVWVSLWESCIKTSFYFTDKNRIAVQGLDIEESLKENFSAAKSIGRLIPLTLEICSREYLKPFVVIAEFKKSII